MAIINSFAIGVDTTANQPAAAAARRLYLSETAGSAYLSPQYDTGAAWVPWRANFSLPIVSPTAIAVACTSGAAYAAAIANGSLFLDFTRFREARFTCWAAITAGTSATAKVVDTTNTQDITNTLTINSGTPQRWTDAAWKALNSATYAGSAQFEIQILQGTAADVVSFYTAQLELR